MFVGRFGIGPLPQVKMYIHDFGIDVWGKDVMDSIVQSFLDGIDNNRDILKKAEYVLAGAWGDGDEKVIDLFVGSDVVASWPGNPDINIGFLVDGVYTKERHICGDFNLVTAEEEYFRRGEGYPVAPKNLEQFMNSWPTSAKYKGLFFDYQNMIKF